MKFLIFLTIIVFAAGEINGQKIKDAKGLKVGFSAPVFNAIDSNENIFDLEDALTEGPVVLIFYRGFWCPVCNKHLSEFQDSLKMIEDAGAKVIAVSPEKPEYLNKMAEKTGAEFTLLYDDGYKIATAYNVNFMPGTADKLIYNFALGAKLKSTHSDRSQQLPIPATYVISSRGRIIWRHFDPDYHKRASVRDIINALNE